MIFSSGYGAGDLAAPYRGTPALGKPFSQNDLSRLLGTLFPAK